jgi:serine/threonine kinase PknH
MESQDDPEARIRELERSISDVASRSELGAGKRRNTSRGLRGQTIVMAVVAISLVALAIGAAVVLTRHSGGGPSASVPSARPSSTPSTTVAPAHKTLQTLYRLLPKDYNSKNCSPVSTPNRQALVTLQCGQTADPHSPASASFSLYPNAAALTDAFQNGIDEDSVTPCPGGQPSPGTWATDEAPKVNAGAVVCGNYNNQPDVMWTNDHDLLLSDIQGPDLDALFQFWSKL